MRIRKLRIFAALVAFALLTPVLTIASVDPAAASSRFRIAWTQIGIFPRSAPDMGASKVGAALADGTWIDVACETLGTSVTSNVATTDIWERLTNGTYIPNAFVETGANGWTPGVPRCDPVAQAPTPQAPTPQAPPQEVPAAEDPAPPTSAPQNPVASWSYDRSAAVEWATGHYLDADNWMIADCTVFVSAALNAGGIPVTESWQPQSTDVDDQASFPLFLWGWGKGPTKRWAAADFLKNYLATEQVIATVTEISSEDLSAGGAQLGDLVMYDWGHEDDPGVIDHVAIVTGFSDDGEVLVTQKEDNQLNRAWAWSLNSGKPFAESDPGTRFYLVHITM
jgi:hypothetical protein